MGFCYALVEFAKKMFPSSLPSTSWKEKEDEVVDTCSATNTCPVDILEEDDITKTGKRFRYVQGMCVEG